MAEQGRRDTGRVGGRIRRYARVTGTMTGLAARMAGERYLGIEIDRSKHAADLREALFGPRPALFAHVADDAEHGVVGFSLWFLNYSTWLGTHGIYLEDLFVQPEHRGSGYGKALLANLARICVERGYGRLEWWVLDEPNMQSSWRFYESQGARALREWVPHRVTGDALIALAGRTTSQK